MIDSQQFTISLSGVPSIDRPISDIFTVDGVRSPNIHNDFLEYLESSSLPRFKNGVVIKMNKNCTLTLNNDDLFLYINTGATFDGNSKTLTLTGNQSDYLGLIDSFYGGNIKDLNLEVISSNVYLGQNSGWICRSSSTGTINYCSSNGPIPYTCGGICGTTASGTCFINNCYSTGTIGSGAGGICGANSFCYITGCFSSGAINGGGGICGGGFKRGTIDSCYSTGVIRDGGGICGNYSGDDNNNFTIMNCYSTGSMTNFSGGICSFSTGPIITNCYSTGAVDSTSEAILNNEDNTYGNGTEIITGCYGKDDLTNGQLPNGWDTGLSENKWEQTDSYPRLQVFKSLPWLGYDSYSSQIRFFFTGFEITNNNGVLTTFPGATYLWDNNSTAYTRTITQSGTYSVTITFEDFSVSKSITILEPTLSITKTVNNGIITLTANPINGIGAYTYLWSNSETTKSINVESGDFSVTVTSGTETVMASYSVLSATIVIDGAQLTVNASGGTGSYTYLWDNEENTQSITFVISSNRSVTVTSGDQTLTVSTGDNGDDITITNDNNGNLSVPQGYTSYSWTKDSNAQILSQTRTLQISLPGIYSVKISSGTDSVTRSITINPIDVTITNDYGTLSTNLTGNYTYLWSDGSTGATMKIRSPGTYSVKVFLPNSIGSQIFTINSTLGVSINYQSSGILTANPTGSGPYRYLWSVYDTANNGQSYSVFRSSENSGETTGSIRPKYATREYVATIYTENEIGTGSRVIKRSTGIIHRINPGNGTLTAEINTAGFSANYLWSTGATTATIQIDSNISEYSVVFYFNDGTISTRSTIILTNTIPNITISNNNFGLLTVTSSLPSGFPSDVTPNYSYSWNGDSSLTNTKHINEPGTYTVTITLENPSSSSSPYTGSKTIIIEDAGAGILNGKEGLLTVSVPEGDQTFHYEWSGGEVPESNFPSVRKITGPGTYIAIVYSSDGKISKLTKTIVPLTVSISRYANVLTVTPDNSNNEYKYKWDTNQVTTGNTKTITTNGTYSVIVYGDDSFGSASFVVAPLSVSISNDSQGNLTQSAQGGTNIGYQYTWEKDSVVITNPVVDSAGNYKVTVRDSANNEASSSITINSITPTITNNLDGTLTAGPSNYNFKWNTNTNFGNTTNITNGNKDSPVTYTVTAYSSNGYGKASRTISNVSVDLTRVENKVVAPPGYTYKWSDGQNSDRVIINNPGTYSVTVYSNSSYGVGSLTIGSITPVINSSGSTLSVAGSYDYYLWSNGLNTSTITITSSGIYSVKVFSGYNFGSAAITINNLIVNINFDSDGNLRASADGATSFSWNDGSTNPIKSGININTTYTVTASSDSASGSKSVTITDASDLRSIASNNPGIIGFYTADEVKAYIWNDGVRGHEREVNRSGDYSITVYFQSGNSYSIGTWTRNIPQLDFAIQNYSLPATFREFFPPVAYSNPSYKHSWSVVGAASITPDNDSASIFYRSARPRGVGTYKLIISGIGGYGEATRIIKPLTAEIKFNEIIDEDGFPIHFIRVIPSGGDDVFYFYDWKYTEPNVKTSDDRTMITLTSEHGSSKSRYIVDVTCIGELRFTAVYDYNTPITRRPPGQISANLLLSSDNKTVSSNQVLSWLGNLFSNSSIGKSIQETSDAMRKARERKESKPKTKLSFSWSDINFVDPVVKSAQSLDNKGQNSFDALLDRASQLSASAKKLKEKALF